MASNRRYCMIVIGIALLFLIYISLYMAYLGTKTTILKSEMNEKFSMKEELSLDKNAQLKTCDYTEESFAYPVMSPNIPDDPKIMTYIGYNLNKYNKGIKGGITGVDRSLVKLMKPLLKYDGIHKAVKRGKKDIEIQKWKMNEKTTEMLQSNLGYYGSNKLLPPKNFPF